MSARSTMICFLERSILNLHWVPISHPSSRNTCGVKFIELSGLTGYVFSIGTIEFSVLEFKKNTPFLILLSATLQIIYRIFYISQEKSVKT